MRLAGYIRVSTEGQVDAYGKDVQRKYILDWAELNGHEIYEWFEEDAVSGKTDNSADRPALSELLACCEEFEGVVFFDATRIARRSIVQETLLSLIWATGLRVFTTTAGEMSADEEDPTKILIRQILGVIAEFDHRSIVKKLQSARKMKASQGGYIGGIPRYGVRIEAGEFVIDEVESRVIEKICELRTAGISLKLIADSLNANRIPTKTGKQWFPAQVQRIIKRSNDIA